MATFSRRRNAKDQIMCKIGMNLLRLQSSKRARTQYRVLCSMHAPICTIRVHNFSFNVKWAKIETGDMKWAKMEWVRNRVSKKWGAHWAISGISQKSAKFGMSKKWNAPKIEWVKNGISQKWNDQNLEWAINEMSHKWNETNMKWAIYAE